MPNLNERARQLRRDSTDAERAIWRLLRDRRLAGYKFRRQAPIDRYIVDLVCFDKNIIIEVDGGQHQRQTRYDRARTEWLESRGFTVLRFWNNDVLENPEGVLESIRAALQRGNSPSP